MVPFESLSTVSYLHFVATMAVSSSILTQYMNLMDRQTDRHCTMAQAALIHSIMQLNGKVSAMLNCKYSVK